MTPQEFFKLSEQPLAGHTFYEDSKNCKTCSRNSLRPTVLSELARLPKVDEQVLKAAKVIFSLDQKNLDIPPTTPYFDFIVVFCNARPSQIPGSKTAFYETGIWAAKARTRHALAVYFEQLSQ